MITLWVFDGEKIAILLQERVEKGPNSENLHIWKACLTLEIVKQDKCPKERGSSILLCPTIIVSSN